MPPRLARIIGVVPGVRSQDQQALLEERIRVRASLVTCTSRHAVSDLAVGTHRLSHAEEQSAGPVSSASSTRGSSLIGIYGDVGDSLVWAMGHRGRLPTARSSVETWASAGNVRWWTDGQRDRLSSTGRSNGCRNSTAWVVVSTPAESGRAHSSSGPAGWPAERPCHA